MKKKSKKKLPRSYVAEGATQRSWGSGYHVKDKRKRKEKDREKELKDLVKEMYEDKDTTDDVG